MRYLFLLICVFTFSAVGQDVPYFSDLPGFDVTAPLTDNILQSKTATSDLFRVGSKNSYFERKQNTVTAPFNEIRMRTNETNPCCGGFAEFWTISDGTHSYAYIRAQRATFIRADDLFVGNFFDTNRFRMALEMDNTSSHPLEDTSRFRVGDWYHQTVFIDLQNVTRRMTLQADSILVKPQRAAPNGVNDPCIAGEVAFDDKFFYRCVSDNLWRRAEMSEW